MYYSRPPGRPMPSLSRSVLLALLALPACSTTTSTTTGVPPITELVVDPALFLGNVACLDAPGAMRLYVATLTDISGDIGLDASPPQMPSSAPTPCGVAVHFQRVVPGRQYVADIQGYDRTDLVPLSCWQIADPLHDPHATCAGSPIMVDATTGEYVSPRWETSCGRDVPGAPAANTAPIDGGATDAAAPAPPAAPVTPDGGGSAADAAAPAAPVATDGGFNSCHRDGGQRLGGPVCAEYLTTVPLRGCAPPREVTSGPQQTAVGVSLEDALGGIGCDTPAGKVETFTVQIAGKPATARTAACGAAVELEGLTGGVGYQLDVSATVTGGSVPLWTTSCFRTAVSGVTVRAACDPFPELHGG